MSNDSSVTPGLSTQARYLLLAAAFLGWMFAGVQMSVTSLAMRDAAIDLLDRTGSLHLDRYNTLDKLLTKIKKKEASPDSISLDDKEQLNGWKASAAGWFAWYQCAFLFGAAAGGLVFGRLGDRIGRTKAMAASILCYSAVTMAAYYSQSPEQLLVFRFVACMGVGGMWPNGVALVSEAWSNLSRPMVAGIIGTAANVGIFAMSTLCNEVAVTPDDWRWVLPAGAAFPLLLGVGSWFLPESPRWLASRKAQSAGDKQKPRTAEVFQSRFVKFTAVGILLATIPLIGGWGSANWMMPWAGEAGETASPPNPFLKAQVGQARAFTGMIGSLLGGWIGSWLGRRRTYFLVSLAALFCAQYAFRWTTPLDASFLYWVAALGFFSGIYFGWLPLFLPELFPTRIRSTGAGVSFNFGRILTAVTIFATGALMTFFKGDYARIGQVTSLIFAVGMIAIFLAPDTSKKQLED